MPKGIVICGNELVKDVINGFEFSKHLYRMSEPEYVYVCRYKGSPVYVGVGKGKRIEHCISGVSSSKELNRLYFTDKENMSVEKVVEGIHVHSDALRLERAICKRLWDAGIEIFNRDKRKKNLHQGRSSSSSIE